MTTKNLGNGIKPNRFEDSWRQGKSSSARGYGYKWRNSREVFLTNNPLCIMCKREGKIKAAEVVDHIIPHKGDMTLFWDTTNWQPLCKQHHDRDKQRIEKGTLPPKINLDGTPEGWA